MVFSARNVTAETRDRKPALYAAPGKKGASEQGRHIPRSTWTGRKTLYYKKHVVCDQTQLFLVRSKNVSREMNAEYIVLTTKNFVLS